jgi:hypothetical protein
MINVILRGGLGNRLFQYAVARHLAIKNNTGVRFNIQYCAGRHNFFDRKVVRQLSLFNIKPIVYTANIYNRIGRRLGIYRSSYEDRIYKVKDWGFFPEVLELKDGAHLDGYFQSEKYFHDVEQIIRNDLRFKKDFLDEEGVIYRKQIAEVNSVSLHIRRGDYLKSKLLNVCDMKYYIKSIEYMRERLETPYFYVFSDDIEWCSRNLSMPDCRFVNIEASRNNPVIDFQLMSLCRHNIISNSSFSWWAAWLNEHCEKIVIAPNRWFNDGDMNMKALQDTIPDNWIRMDFK